MSAAWGLLVLAGLFEIGMALALRPTQGFTRLAPSLLFLVLAATSFALLARAAQTLPIGTAYAVWTGIGAGGVAAVGVIWGAESADPLRLFFIFTLIASVVGLKLTSAH